MHQLVRQNFLIEHNFIFELELSKFSEILNLTKDFANEKIVIKNGNLSIGHINFIEVISKCSIKIFDMYNFDHSNL